MKCLLAVSWCMPPLPFPRSIQVARSLKYLALNRWESVVVTVDPMSVGGSAYSDLSLESLYARYYRLVLVKSVERWLPLRLMWGLLPSLMWLPDAKRVWVGGAVRATRNLLVERNRSALISFGQPWSNHLVGLRIHRESRIPWIAHFSDPWVDSPYYHHGCAWQRRTCQTMEEAVIREADALVFITAHTANLVMRKYPEEWRQKVHVIPHGYDTEALPHWERPAQPHPRLRLVYTGNFYPGMRTPESLLQALRLLKQTQPVPDRLEVTFVGQMVKEYQEMVDGLDLANAVEFVGPRPYVDSL